MNWEKLSQSFNSVTYSEELSLFCAVGNNGLIMTSPDGVNWTKRNTITGNNLLDVVYYEKFIAVGIYGVIYTSSDGINWNRHKYLIIHYIL